MQWISEIRCYLQTNITSELIRRVVVEGRGATDSKLSEFVGNSPCGGTGKESVSGPLGVFTVPFGAPYDYMTRSYKHPA